VPDATSTTTTTTTTTDTTTSPSWGHCGHDQVVASFLAPDNVFSEDHLQAILEPRPIEDMLSDDTTYYRLFHQRG
jgi:hypothetical protein